MEDFFMETLHPVRLFHVESKGADEGLSFDPMFFEDTVGCGGKDGIGLFFEIQSAVFAFCFDQVQIDKNFLECFFFQHTVRDLLFFLLRIALGEGQEGAA